MKSRVRIDIKGKVKQSQDHSIIIIILATYISEILIGTFTK